MADPSVERHTRHESSLKEMDQRVVGMEEQVSTNTQWIFGPDGAPHRGAEQRITAVETRLSQGKLVFLQYVLPSLTTAVLSSAAVVIVTIISRRAP